MPTADYVRDRILAAFPDGSVEVVDYTGTGDHFRAEITSSAFAGLGLVDQHKLVYAAVDSDLKDGSIHALSISTRVPGATSTSGASS
jgi:stress-induced morphogen